jgi:hypothetical protein
MRGMPVVAALVLTLAVAGCGDESPAGATQAPERTAAATPSEAGDIDAAGEAEATATADAATSSADDFADDFAAGSDEDTVRVTVELRYAAGVESAQLSIGAQTSPTGGWGMAMVGLRTSTQGFPSGRLAYQLEATVERSDGTTRELKDTVTLALDEGDRLIVTVSPTSMKVRKR